jgi:ABC-type transport system involved in Fe-S cluster assembly fused permease/ATPase subunit
MKYRIATLLLLVVATILYIVGFGSGMAVVLVAAVALEIYFWTRVVRGRRDARARLGRTQ